MFEKGDSSNRQYKYMVAFSASFTAKFELVFVLKFRKRFILKPTERAYVLLKNYTRDFQNSPSFERSGCFYVAISGKFECFQYFNFETNFLENENLFKKTGVPFFSLKYQD